MSKVLCDGHFKWPRDSEELRDLTYAQYRLLMDGFTIDKGIKERHPELLV